MAAFKVRFVVELTGEQHEILQQGALQASAAEGKRVSMSEILRRGGVRLAEEYLDGKHKQ